MVQLASPTQRVQPPIRDAKGLLGRLRDYAYWECTTPQTVLSDAIRAGGWTAVWPEPEALPKWASRVRNAFNLQPRVLRRLADGGADKARKSAQLNPLTDMIVGEAAIPHCYEDEHRQSWLQTHQSGTIYHFGGETNVLKKIEYGFKSQQSTPVFKLLHMDDAGGSSELILHNRGGEAAVGEVGRTAWPRVNIVREDAFIATYNYADTFLRGFGEHQRLDIDAHTTESGFYYGFDLRQPLGERQFPPFNLIK